MTAKSISHYLDAIGTLTATACAVHCLLTPLVIGLLPLLGIGFLAADWFEDIAVISAISLGVISMIHGYHHHRRFRVVGILVAGVILLATGRWIAADMSQVAETSLVVAGGLAVASAHWVNRRLCQTCTACHHAPLIPCLRGATDKSRAAQLSGTGSSAT